ncbi:hypothetical protein COL922a_005373 [Colletotrichum nupharicola]|nr:hypothetical protein COL922a_005373 [Colletotrichum nupharicola]
MRDSGETSNAGIVGSNLWLTVADIPGYFSMILSTSSRMSWPFILTIVGQNIAGHTKRAFTNTLLLMVFAAVNIAGPFFFRSQDGPKYVLAIAIILVCFCAALLTAVVLRLYMTWENKRRDKKYGGVDGAQHVDGVRLGMHDKTDLENPDFRYVL